MENTMLEVTLYTVEDIKKIFHCGEKKAYALMHKENFPTMRLGGRLYITHENLAKFLKQNGRKNIHL